MTNNIIIINGPNLNLLGEREQSQYGSITFKELKQKSLDKAKELNVNLEFFQSNIEGEIVTTIQEAKKKCIIGLICDATRLSDVRRNRIQSMNEDRPSDYTDEKKILNELEVSKKIFKKYNWPIIDVTRKSVEETAASIIKILDIINSR